MTKTVLALTAVLMLTLTGCGGGGGGGGGASSEDSDAAKEISKSLMEQNKGEDMLAVKQEDADCIGEGMVDEIGTDKLKDYGFLKEDGTVAEDLEGLKMSTEDAGAMTDTMFGCTDVMAMMKDSMSAQMGDQDPALQKCIDEVLTEERVRDLLTGLFSGNEAAAGKSLTAPLMACAQKAMGG